MLTPLRLFPNEDETIAGVGAALRAGRTTCAAVLEHCFHQIDLWDDRVRAWVVVDRAGAMRQARALDAELAEGKCRGPLHGIPVGVKDIIDVAGLPTAAGFKPWRDRVAERDADLVARLRLAGAVIMGKTVTTQFAWIDPPITRNPWALDRTPGGSSSGSAAAVATGMCLAAVGTQTGGSVIRPAAFCGVAGCMGVGFSLLEEGVVPFAPNLDRPGFFTRSALDLGLYEHAVGAGSYAHSIPPIVTTVDAEDHAAHLRAAQAEPYDRLFIRPRGFFDRRAEPEALDAFERALDALRDAGAEVIDHPDDEWDFEGVLRHHRVIMAVEAAATHEERFRANRDDYAPLIASLIDEGLSTPATRYVRCRQEQARRQHSRHDMFRRGAVALLTPAAVGPAPDTTTTGNPCFNSPWTYLGLCAACVPTGLASDGLPLSLQIIGNHARADSLLFQASAWCEGVFRRADGAGSLRP